jgi:ATP-dependent DNA helicase RecG
VSLGLLTGGENKLFTNGKTSEITRKELLKKIRTGGVQVIVGTHALIEEKVIFHKLVLAIIDEQHRFGVKQRKSLRERIAETEKRMPHLLSMTATPIPRTLSLVLYGDLDVSFLEGIPKNRKPIITKIVPPEKRALAYQFIAKQIDLGRQVFVLCPLIDISDKTGAKSAKEEFEKLQKYFGKYRVGLLHGKMSSEEKNKTMALMKDGKIDILVATSVIEVGIDIPNATVMMIEGAERFGLAQLHQFRGRVGRGEHQSFCLLFTDSKNEKTAERLKAVISAKNGFELAEMDLKIRGAGEIYGTRQSGIADFKIATLYDYAIMKQAAEASEIILENDGTLESYPLLKQKMDEHRSSIHFE